MGGIQRFGAFVALALGVHLAAYSQEGSLIAGLSAGVFLALFVLLVTE
ncbi:hypothetical protein [Thioalkalivibrio sp. ALJ8]|nr:hypothetical protein [Thioalkalivibrio sp. ALJ8]